MAKHTQIIRRQIDDAVCVCVWPFCEKGAYRVLFSPMILHKFTESHIYHKVYIFSLCFQDFQECIQNPVKDIR